MRGTSNHTRQHMMVGPVRGGNLILALQRGDRPHRHRLLTDTRMQRAMHQRLVVHQPLLKSPNQQQLVQHQGRIVGSQAVK